jgi:predicted ester cyclase
MVEMGRAPFTALTFTLAVGPIVDGDFLASRWAAEGRYRGGLPGATAPAGTPVTYGGADIFRLENGQIAEYWVSADALHLMVQLGAVTIP